MVYFRDPEAALEVTVHADRDVPPATTERVRRRLLFALGRLARHVRSVRVRLMDVNGRTRGGIDKQCVIAVRLARLRRLLVIEDVDRTFDAAIDRAADRAGHAVARASRLVAATAAGSPRRLS